MKYISIYKALYDYTAQTEEELSFKEDDILYIIENDDHDWWKAQAKATSADVDGPVGLVPANHIAEAEPIGTVSALYDYTAQQEEELTFKEDDVMTLYENDDPDWFLVKANDGKIGLVPSNYIEVKLNNDTASIDRTADNNDTQFVATAQEQPTVSAAILNSPEKPRSTSTDQDEAISWSVHEYDTDKKKKKKSKGNLFVGNGMLYYGSETDKTLPVRQFSILDIGPHTYDGKNVHIEIQDASRTVLDFQTASKSEAKAIVTKIGSSKAIAAAASAMSTMEAQVSTPSLAIASPDTSTHRESDYPPQPETPETTPSPACEPRWAIALYSFDAAGDDETSIKEGEQILVVDYVSDEGWWRVEHQDGTSGIVPATYVQFHEDYEEDLRRKQEEEEAAARLRQRQAEEEARRAEAAKKRQQEEAARQREEEEKRKAAEAAQRAMSAPVPPTVGHASPRRSQIPAPPPPTVSPSPTLHSEQAAKSVNIPSNHSLPSRPKHATDSGKPDPSKIRTWTDRTGAFKVDAQFLSCNNGKIRLHKTNGVKIDVPVEKMCVADLRFIESETGQRLIEDTADDVPLARLTANKQETIRARESKGGWSWFDYFTRANIPARASTAYAAAFDSDGLRERDLENLTHRKMKSLGMSEKHVQRIQRFIERGVPEPPSDDEGMGHSPRKKGKKSVTFGGASFIEDNVENEDADQPIFRSRQVQEQISNDEKLARQLQEQINQNHGSPKSDHHGSGLQRRGTGRPTPANSAPRGVNQVVMDKIKSQLSTEPLKPTPAPAPSPASQARSAISSSPLVSATAATAPTVSPSPTQFEDDAWTVRSTPSSATPASSNTTWPVTAPPSVQPAGNTVQPASQQQQVFASQPSIAAAMNPIQTVSAQPSLAPAMNPVQSLPAQPSLSPGMNTFQTPATQPQVAAQQAQSPIPPRQRPTPSTPRQNSVDPQLLSQWTTSSPQTNTVQQRGMQFENQQSPSQQLTQQQVTPLMQQQQQQQQPFAATQHLSPLPFAQPQQNLNTSPIQQFAQPQFSSVQPQVIAQVPVNSALPAPLVPSSLHSPSLGAGIQPQVTGVPFNPTGMSPANQGTSGGRTWANATPENPFGNNAAVQQPMATGITPLSQIQTGSQQPFSNSSLQPSQVFASMTNNATGFQQPQQTGFGTTVGQITNPNDKYSVFKAIDSSSPSVFQQNQQQAPFQQPQATGFGQTQGNAPMNAFNSPAVFPNQQQQFYNRW